MAGTFRGYGARVRPPPLPHQLDVLDRVQRRVEAQRVEGSEPPVVVFELDWVLFDPRPRTARILQDYAERLDTTRRSWAEALAGLPAEQVQAHLAGTLAAAGLHDHDLLRDLTSFWRTRFFSDAYAALDVPVEGAPAFVRALHRAGGNVCYLGSGRDLPGMLLGTVSNLRDRGFPVAEPGVELVLKPDGTMGDEAFKRDVLPRLDRCGRIVAFFDADPASCHLGREAFPEADVVQIDLLSVSGPPPVGGVEPISDFRRG